MAQTLHGAVFGQIQQCIVRQLFLIQQADNKPASDFAKVACLKGSPQIILTDRGCHCPDGAFDHENTSCPGVIIVSYLQKRKYLPFLADDYILGSNGFIQMVTGIDIQ